MSWEKIAQRVTNLKGGTPCWKVCRDVCHRMNTLKVRVEYKYGSCGGRPRKITPELRRWLVGRLMVVRRKHACTSATLQRELAQKKQLVVEGSSVRRALQAEGYKYSEEVTAERLDFAREVLRLAPTQLRNQLNLCLDGVVLAARWPR